MIQILAQHSELCRVLYFRLDFEQLPLFLRMKAHTSCNHMARTRTILLKEQLNEIYTGLKGKWAINTKNSQCILPDQANQISHKLQTTNDTMFDSHYQRLIVYVCF